LARNRFDNSGNLHYSSIWLYLPSVWIIGVFQFALSESMLHEAAHYNLFANKPLNNNLEFLYALPFFGTTRLYRKEHLLHHTHLNKPDDHIIEDYNKIGLTSLVPNFFWLWFLKPVTGFAGLYYTRRISFTPFFNEGIKITAFWLIVLAAGYYLEALQIIFYYWLIPMFWCCNSFLYWSEIRDHFNTYSGTRSNLNKVYNVLTHNNGYHFSHHRFPAIPWYNLPVVHKHLLTENKGDLSAGFIMTYFQISKTPGK
jgi:fatty acid desaturase